MKKNTNQLITVILAIIAAMTICQGCSSKAVPEPHALAVDSTGVTGAGIHIGSSYTDWIDAYGNYEIQIYDGENLVPFDPVPEEAIEDQTSDGSSDVSHDGRYMIGAFYVDETPVSTDELCRTEGVEAAKLADHLASAQYLEKHSVIFRYIIFTVTDETVSDMEYDYLDYNSEL